jgi:hypothetical protein
MIDSGAMPSNKKKASIPIQESSYAVRFRQRLTISRRVLSRSAI